MAIAEQLEMSIRSALRDQGHIKSDASVLAIDADLYAQGMTSHASVNVMLTLEAMLDVEFPDHLLKRSVFASIASIHAALREIAGA